MPDLPAICLCVSLAFGGPGLASSAPLAGDAWLGEDKGKHFTASLVLTTLGGSAARSAGMDARSSRAAGAAAAAAAGIAKEIHDQRQPRNFFSVSDLAWNLAGVAAGYIILRQGE